MGQNKFRFGEEGIVRDRILQGHVIQQKPKTTNMCCRCDVTLSQRKNKRAKFILIIPFIFLIYANVIVSVLNPSGTLLDTVHFLFTEGLRSPALLIQHFSFSHTALAQPSWVAGRCPRGLHSSGVEVGLRPACTTHWLCYLSLRCARHCCKGFMCISSSDSFPPFG